MSTSSRRQDLIKDDAIRCGTDAVITMSLYDSPEGTDPLDLTGVREIGWYIKEQLGPDYSLVIPGLTKTAGRIAVLYNQDEEHGTQITITLRATDTLPVSGDRVVGIFAHVVLVTDFTGLISDPASGRVDIIGTGV